MANWSTAEDAILPAQLAFLAIYNPSLGQSDDTLHDQVLYYYSSKSSRRRRQGNSVDKDEDERQNEDRNERLRQIGLAQGMVEFAKAFSNGENLESVESEKSRILLHELERGWWILASVDLTRLQSASGASASLSTSSKSGTTVEYSSREVCPQSLLLQHLLRAHSIFLLHHGPSLSELYSRMTRQKFCDAIERFWSNFIREWDVLLHGNPAVDVYNGLKLAAGGELGIGVGEEAWGSGEREVLEGFVGRTEGLVDILVSRFGDAPDAAEYGPSKDIRANASRGAETTSSWLASRTYPGSSDGVIFSGTGALNRSSLKSVSAWMEWLYKYGESAYGVRDNPHSVSRRKRKKKYATQADAITSKTSAEGGRHDQESPKTQSQSADTHAQHHTSSTSASGTFAIPPPIVGTAALLPTTLPSTTDTQKKKGRSPERQKGTSRVENTEAFPGADSIVKYMTLGIYGSSWGIAAGRPIINRQLSKDSNADEGSGTQKLAELRELDPKPMSESHDDPLSISAQDVIQGAFLIGLRGDLENEGMTEDEDNNTESGTEREQRMASNNWNRRVSIRTLYVSRTRKEIPDSNDVSSDVSTSTKEYDRLRVVVYVRQPFIFTFLFELTTDSLSMTSLYRALHYQLGPLQRPLVVSTSPLKVFERLWEAADPQSTSTAGSTQPIYDLVYDPANLTIHTTIPNIPDSGTAAAEGLGDSGPPWTRIEALNVHSQILNTYISTRRHVSELERTCKTSRGWWVVWMRLPRGALTRETGANSFREAFLIRKASDYPAPATRKSSGRFGLASSEGSGWGPGKLAEGIGIDTRRYIEGLLSLNR
ncbi:hypothetical protein MMC27_004855 [Xylographa pallens]|nr:hypothetical protein [Xylographa pallens]